MTTKEGNCNEEQTLRARDTRERERVEQGYWVQTPTATNLIIDCLNGVGDVGRVLSESLGTSLELGNRLLSTYRREREREAKEEGSGSEGEKVKSKSAQMLRYEKVGRI